MTFVLRLITYSVTSVLFSKYVQRIARGKRVLSGAGKTHAQGRLVVKCLSKCCGKFVLCDSKHTNMNRASKIFKHKWVNLFEWS
jgi:hypothetical protein